LAVDVHPLLKTRGVPGTHDVPLALKTLEHLLKSEPVELPQFNKAKDDCVPTEDWPVQATPVDIILLEGWCVGATPQDVELLALPINSLESNDDSQGIWRQYVNQCLGDSYQQWFAMIDYLIMLKVPNIESVYQWRGLQEEKLKENNQSKDTTQIISAEKIKRFVQHFERLTLHQLQEMPARADVVFYLNKEHGVESAEGLSELSHE
jgi:D-glycerate 3-kinase